MHRTASITVLAAVLSIATFGIAAAADSAACVTRADNNVTFVVPSQMTRALAYSGSDAQLFIGGLTVVVGALPDTVNAAVSVSAYLPLSGTATAATVRFYDAKGCDVGVATQLAPGLLDFIITTIGERI